MAHVKPCHVPVTRDRKKGRLIIFPIDFADTEIGHGHVISQ